MSSQAEFPTTGDWEDLSLVPRPEEAFDSPDAVASLAAWAPSTSEQGLQVVHIESKGTNATLNKALIKTIGTVEHRVSSVRSSFSVVEKLIDDPALQLCREFPDRRSLLKEWEDIKTVFRSMSCLTICLMASVFRHSWMSSNLLGK